MKLLAVSDIENKALWDYYDPSRLAGVELIVSCGDLNPAYLEFLVTMTNCPLLYVRGNHDRRYDADPPLGCVDIDDRIYNYHGLRILGLGGCMRYGPGSDMYTESEMRRRIAKLQPRIALMGGFDLLVAHAPVFGYGDLHDLPHRGFACFDDLISRWKPKYMCFGHVHREYGGFKREYAHPAGTTLINACGSYVLEIREDEYPAYGKTGSPLYDLYISLNSR